MTKGAEYRKHAQECRALARNVQNDEHKHQLIKMAEAWDSFAAERERLERSGRASELSLSGDRGKPSEA
jgi:hypothetical protein